MTTTLKAKFNGKVLVPQEPVSLPKGELLELRIRRSKRAVSKKTPLQRLAAQRAKLPRPTGLPRDFAAQHDHYLYGTPKRRKP